MKNKTVVDKKKSKSLYRSGDARERFQTQPFIEVEPAL